MIFRMLLLLFAAPFLQACSNLGGAVVSAAQAYYAGKTPPSYASTPLSPQYIYLEVQAPNSSALMVLASEHTPAQGGGLVETWVSASRELLRTRAGFVVGSQGVPNVFESATLQFNPKGQVQGMVLNHSGLGMHQVQLNLLPMALDSIPLKNTALLARARQVNGLVLQAWRGQLAAQHSNSTASPRLQALNNSLHVVGTHPNTGGLVYGLYCQQEGQCIEYLRRTAAQNL